MFTNIKVLIWDIDGTLYQSIPALSKDIFEADYKVIMVHNRWNREKTVEEFQKIYKITTPSSTKTAAILTGLPLIEVAVECEQYKDRTKYLKHDDKLVTLFGKLSGFTHYMLVNSIQEKTREALRVLGLSPDLFTEIVTSEIVGENKPSEKGFRYILEKTGMPPAQHMMIGDREAVDLIPAKNLGMYTCLVWSEKPSAIADSTLQTVYDVDKLLHSYPA